MTHEKGQMESRQMLWQQRFDNFIDYGEWGAFALATVMGSIEEINGLKESARRVVATREGDYRNWDPDILGVDEAAEGYIFDCIGRFNGMKGDDFTATIISEEAGERTFGTGAKKITIISDPFDGSLLYKNDLGAFYYTTVAVYDADGSHLATGIGDCVQRRVDFANAETAMTARFKGAELINVKTPPRSENADLSKATIESYMMKPKFLYQEADDAYSFVETFKPFLSRVKFVVPNGGPCGFSDVAFGRIDVYFAHKQPLIEIFSGQGVARTAGVVITDFDGNEVPFSDDINHRLFVLASGNDAIHEQVLKILSDIKAETGYTWAKPRR